jgi:hypothetical protein
MKEFDRFDSAVSHSMTLAVLAGIILSLRDKGILSPWDISEKLSLIRKEELDETSQIGLDLAREWVWKEFTQYTPPD